MTRSRTVLAVLCLAFGTAAPAQIPSADIAGTWECRAPGTSSTNPPILWIAAVRQALGPDTIEVDGFAGSLRGESRPAAALDGWTRIDVSGSELAVKPASDSRGRRVLLARTGTSASPYRCLRLPHPRA